jgi:hypothetical protein
VLGQSLGQNGDRKQHLDPVCRPETNAGNGTETLCKSSQMRDSKPVFLLLFLPHYEEVTEGELSLQVCIRAPCCKYWKAETLETGP